METAIYTDIDLKIKLLSLAYSKQRMDSKTDMLKLWESKQYEDIDLPEAIVPLGLK